MKYTLLQLVQAVLSSTDSDEINSINDSVESQQVVKIIRSVYFDIIERANLPENYGLVNLTASGDSAKPTLMTVPENVNSVVWLKYDKHTTADTALTMRPVEWKPLDLFIADMDYLDTTDTTNNGYFTHTVNGGTFTVIYNKVVAPAYYTTFDDHTVLFDSYDSTVDTTLQSSKTQAYCKLSIPFNLSDTFVPNLDEPQFSLLLNEAKALAWAELRQTQHAKAEVSAKRGWSHLQKSKDALSKTRFVDTLPNYGRK